MIRCDGEFFKEETDVGEQVVRCVRGSGGRSEGLKKK